MITDILLDEVKKKSCVCLGLDTRPEYIPSFIADRDISTGEKIFEFNRRIVDATYDLVGCYKVQIACYEALGLDGMTAYNKNSIQAMCYICRSSENASRYCCQKYLLKLRIADRIM